VGAAPAQAIDGYEAVLAARVMEREACRRPRWEEGTGFLSRFVPWRMSVLRSLLPEQPWQSAVDAVLPLVGDRQPPAYGARVGPLLKAHVLLSGGGDTPLHADELAELTQCIESVAAIDSAAAWVLRGQLKLRQHGLDGAAHAAHAFTRAAADDAPEAVRREAFENRRRLWGRMNTCDHRLANYLIRTDRQLTPDEPSEFRMQPDDSNDDYAGTRSGAAGLAELLRWKFAHIPACKGRPTKASLLAGGTSRATQVLAAAIGTAASGDAGAEVFCDPFDHDEAFNPFSRVSRPTGLHALSELLKDGLRRDTLNDEAIVAQVQAVLDRLWQALPEPAQVASGRHRVVVPLAPQRFLREYACRVVAIGSSYLGTPTSFVVDRRPTVVVSSAVVRHALFSSAERLAPQVAAEDRSIESLAADLVEGFQMEMAFVLAHELAHAYVDGGRSFAVKEQALDCAAAVNLRAAFGPNATMGLFGSMAEAALEPGRQDQWRLWDPTTVETAVERVGAVHRLLAAPPVPADGVLAHCGVRWTRKGSQHG
jgi:hypothetical protein